MIEPLRLHTALQPRHRLLVKARKDKEKIIVVLAIDDEMSPVDVVYLTASEALAVLEKLKECLSPDGLIGPLDLDNEQTRRFYDAIRAGKI